MERKTRYIWIAYNSSAGVDEGKYHCTSRTFQKMFLRSLWSRVTLEESKIWKGKPIQITWESMKWCRWRQINNEFFLHVYCSTLQNPHVSKDVCPFERWFVFLCRRSDDQSFSVDRVCGENLRICFLLDYAIQAAPGNSQNSNEHGLVSSFTIFLQANDKCLQNSLPEYLDIHILQLTFPEKTICTLCWFVTSIRCCRS